MNIERACEAFLNHCAVERKLSANTLAAYRQDLAEFLRGRFPRRIGKVCGRDLVAFLAHLRDGRGLSPATIRRRMACIRAMFRWLVRRAHLPRSPFDEVEIRIPIPPRLPRCLAEGEMAVSRGQRRMVRLRRASLPSSSSRQASAWASSPR